MQEEVRCGVRGVEKGGKGAEKAARADDDTGSASQHAPRPVPHLMTASGSDEPRSSASWKGDAP